MKLHAWGGSKISIIILIGSKQKFIKICIKLQHIKLKIHLMQLKKFYSKKLQKNENGSVDIIWINGEIFNNEKNNLLNKNWILHY